MIVETIDISLRTGETQIPTTETIRPKDESQIAIIDKTRRAIGMIEIAPHTKGDQTTIRTTLHTGGIQAIIATALRTGEMTIVITIIDRMIDIAKIDDMIVILVMIKTDDIIHRTINENQAHIPTVRAAVVQTIVGTITTIIIVHNEAKVHIRT